MHQDRKPFAIKKFMVVGREAEEKLLEEKAIADLNHRNIVDLIAVYAEPGSIERVLVLDFLEGETLIQYVDNQGPADEKLARDICRQMVAGMAHMHEKGILHRDFNGANILIDSHKEHKVTIIDFGLCEIFPVPGVAFHVENVTGGGMPGFRPPEMVSEPPDTHSYSLDIWALGANLWLLMTGERTFTRGREPPASPEDKSGWSMENRITYAYTRLSEDLKTLLKELLHSDKFQRPNIHTVEHCKWLGGDGRISRKIEKDHVDSHVLLGSLTCPQGKGHSRTGGPITSTVFEYATWSYILMDWVQGDLL